VYIKLKNAFLILLKFSGVFALARFLNRKKLPILCYHGISVNDEHLFMPSNYITFKTFQKRIELLIQNNYRFIRLSDALNLLQQNQLPPRSVVLTIDDGFTNTFKEMIPFLLQRKIPVMNYITTYKTINQTPIFRLATQYLFWKLQGSLDVSILKDGLLENYTEDKTILIDSGQSMWQLIRYAETKLSDSKRHELLKELQRLSGITIDADTMDSFTIASESILKEFSEKGLDIQLHTHRHLTPELAQDLKKEIQDNIDVLSKVASHKLEHFCYPSGVWAQKDLAPLKEMQIQTATTCDPGLCDQSVDWLKLPRIIESEAMSMLQFEAEVIGIGDWLRKIKNLLKPS
jgi:peptidoglycan/xylan/chitin deacetylase (PgdA/CDA1 family)